MTLTREDLSAISQLLDEKVVGRFETIESDISTLQNSVTKTNLTLENMLIPRLNTIESCYIDTYRRYQKDADRMEAAFEDIELLKRVVAEHSEKLQKLA